MTSTSKTIVFFGTDDFSLVALQGLVESGYNIAAVVTKPDSKSGRGQILTASSVKKLAIEHKIPVWQPLKVSEINDKPPDALPQGASKGVGGIRNASETASRCLWRICPKR